METTKKCPYCGEEIKVGAKKCRFCNEWLVERTNETAFKEQDIHPQTIAQIQTDRKKTMTGYWIIIVFVVVFLIGGIYILSNNKQASPSIAVEENSLETEIKQYQDPYDVSNDEYDHWLGTMVVDGCVYRLCDTLVRLTFEKNGEGTYKGNIWMGLGSYLSDNSGRFDYWYGQLEGKIRAKATSGNSLLVTMVSCSAEGGVHGELLNPIPFKSGDQILLITKKGSNYEAKPIGKMENFLDGCEISVIK